MNTLPILKVKNITIAFKAKNTWNTMVHGVSFSLFENEILGIVGESGSGKSVTALSIMGLLPEKVSKISEGTILYEEKDLIKYSKKQWQKLRGNQISMIFQEPMSALNPSMTCGKQVAEILKIHCDSSHKEAKKQTLILFNKVKLPRPEDIFNSYPHQISGGQMQRVMIAIAIACKPNILIADEPTTALDVTVQKEIIALLKDLQKETNMSIIFISHDLSLVSEIADRALVMYQGKIVEQGAIAQLFHSPKHQYTKALLHTRPSLTKRAERLPTIADFLENRVATNIISAQERAIRHKKLYKQKPLLEVINLEKEYFSNAGFFKKKTIVKAVNDLSFKLFEGETLGLVGESGCGKSTLGKAILQLEKATKGSIKYRGKEISNLSEADFRRFRKEIQIIFQDPYSSLNPRVLIGEAILEPMKVHHLHKNNKTRKAKVIEILKQVGLTEAYFYRYPHELSGGQRQRIGIARTIALEPKLIICDESVSALDISVQAQVLNLLNDLKEKYGFTYIFISHDLAVVKYMADQLLVMNAGKIEEIGEADEIYANPEREYTKKLIAAIPKGK
ncbi:MAG: ABC transporter ATP-binding protein [Flavobacteriaceae bacterium CG_4_8_14_3_um_filter_34_10]|nr:MAG: ABC transporter ATP-binding protein [Flavobacteriaceae bacterium CG2_30_34_30]PIQ18286.1 MAG: ABC transporter ATP-binding protein [Flavobacteriaceae bacterium CG18_big_fil_WC_8_21_14_2_50_34_36]PIV48484.1 MAG: ABC transporter ATP-binding protein [Flavobacteriaceae bacterium CG02_land_8_20_14_3_00_34_13]PIX09546.1 MAG: ABC transporter ATP-binding protein [Flavobacteriaceae bacterium CG_4_8_14_3_um_filter_34_10]PIZ07102.1 MAG: ABC transporter ATP-binding protein [Flavobacteriaceae bacteri